MPSRTFPIQRVGNGWRAWPQPPPGFRAAADQPQARSRDRPSAATVTPRWFVLAGPAPPGTHVCRHPLTKAGTLEAFVNRFLQLLSATSVAGPTQACSFSLLYLIKNVVVRV